MSRQALVLLVLVILGGSAAFYFLRDDGGAEVGLSKSASQAGDSPTEVQEPLEPTAGSEPEPELALETRASERVEAAPGHALRGRVVVPAGTPGDEQLWVTASVAERSFETRVAGGAFELSLPADVERGTLGLRGHYLFIAGELEFDASQQKQLVLEPVLGARIGIVVRPPAMARASGELVASTVVSASTGYSWTRANRSQPLGAGWTTNFDALDPGIEWTLHVRNPELYGLRKGPLVLEPGQFLQLELDLIRGARFAGRVLHADGRPAAGCEVTARNLSDTGMFGVDSETLVADAEGAFDFRGQRPGLSALLFELDGTPGARHEVERLADGEERVGLQIVLGEGDRIAGRVVWPDGWPAVGAQVLVSSQFRGGGHGVELQAGEDGRFEAVALSGPPYRLRAIADREQEEATWRALQDEVLPGSENIELLLQPGNRVLGRVLDDSGASIEEFKVLARQVASGNSSGLEKHSEKFEDEEGRFALANLPEGDWNLHVTAKGHGDSTARRLTLPDLAGVELELVLPREAGVSGRVLDPDGTPASGGSVRVPAGFNVKKGKVDEEGNFHLEGLAPGTHSLSGQGSESVWGPSQELTLAPGEERTGIELLSMLPGSISGVMHSSITEREGRQVRLANSGYTFNANATTDADGRFTFEGLAPQEYRVYLDFASRGGLNREWAEKYAARSEYMLTLAEGEEVEIVLGGPREGEILVEGQLRLGDEPLENQLVYVYPGPEGMNFPVTVGYAGEGGHFELRLPEPGDYAFTSAPGADFGFGRRIDVPDVATHALEIELGRGSIAGTLFGPDGEPRPSHTLLLRRAAAIPDSRRPGDMHRSKTKDDGSFLFPNIEDGRWELRSGGFYNDHRNRSEGLAIRSDLVVAGGAPLEGVELHLRAGAVLSGTCLHADGSPATGARVYVTYADGSRMLSWSGERVDWQGGFLVPSVDPGLVEVSAELEGARTLGVSVELSADQEGYVELVFD